MTDDKSYTVTLPAEAVASAYSTLSEFDRWESFETMEDYLSYLLVGLFLHIAGEDVFDDLLGDRIRSCSQLSGASWTV